MTDPAGDTNGSPPYADLASVAIQDDGHEARIIVDMAGMLPARLAEGEAAGVGVDLYRGATTESDYQLFADGSADGWSAYLQTPKGMTPYPGEFQAGANRLVFQLPWSSLGDLRGAGFRAFADWSKKGLVLNESGQDRAPGAATAPFHRTC